MTTLDKPRKFQNSRKGKYSCYDSNQWLETKINESQKVQSFSYKCSTPSENLSNLLFKVNNSISDVEDRKILLKQHEIINNCSSSKEAVCRLIMLRTYWERRSRSTRIPISLHVANQLETQNEFTKLVNQWRKETRGISSTTELVLHPAYQQIIGMGEAVVPLLLRELEKKSGQWFWALKAITREDPVPSEYRGRTKDMIRIWLEWGRSKGYKW